MAKEEAKAPESVQFMGKECLVTKRSDGSERIAMRKSEYEGLLEGFGVTKEVREQVRSADDAITKEAAEFLSKRLLKANKGKKEGADGYVPKAELVLGGGNCGMEYELIPHRHHTSVDMKTKEKRESDKFGIFRVTKIIQMSAEIRKEGGLLDQIATDFEKSFKK